MNNPNSNSSQSVKRLKPEKKLKKQQASESQFTDKERKKQEADNHSVGGF